MAITFKGGKPESKTFTLLEPGEYQFTVTECKQDTTQAADDCVKVTLNHESRTNVFETLIFDSRDIEKLKKTKWKFLQFVAACGQDPEGGNFEPEDAIGQIVTAKIVKENGRKKNEKDPSPDAERYPDKNKVEAFLFGGDEI